MTVLGDKFFVCFSLRGNKTERRRERCRVVGDQDAMLVGRFLARPVCHVLGYLYPAFQSYRAVQTGDPALHTQWLTFWIVSTHFSVLEAFGDGLLSWLPFYYEAKVALLVWLVAPQFKGATKIYNRFLDPYLHKYEKDIDENLEHMKHRSVKGLGDLSAMGMKHLRSQSSEFIKLGHSVLMKHLSEGDLVSEVRINETVEVEQTQAH